MRHFFFAIGLVSLGATTSAAQLLGNPAAKPTDKPVAGRQAADAKGDAAAKRPGTEGPAAPRANALFAVLDIDGNGEISKVELRKAIKNLKTLDTDDDDIITLAEASVGGGPIGPSVPGGAVGNDPQITQLMTMDRNKDGKLTEDEVPREMQQMLGAADQNRDREITQQELAAAIANSRNRFGAGPWQAGARGPIGGGLNDAEQAMGQFLQYDKNGDGQLSEGELPPQMKRMMQADRNKDGSLDAGELQSALAQQGGKARALRGGIDPNEARGRKNSGLDRKAPADQN